MHKNRKKMQVGKSHKWTALWWFVLFFFAHFARCLMFATGCSESAQLSQVELHCNILQLHWGKQMTLFLLQWKNSVNALCSLCRKHGNTFLCESNDTNVTKSSASTTSTSTTSWKVGHGQLSHWVWPEEEWTSVKDCEESWFDVKNLKKKVMTGTIWMPKSVADLKSICWESLKCNKCVLHLPLLHNDEEHWFYW